MKNRINNTLFNNLLIMTRKKLFKTVIEDTFGYKFSYLKLFFYSIIFGDALKNRIQMHTKVGILLPNTCFTVCTFYALQYLNKICCMLNYTSGFSNIASCIKTSEINSIVTSRQFLSKVSLEDEIANLHSEKDIIYLEDILRDKKIVSSLLNTLKLFLSLNTSSKLTDDKFNKPAVILYTSGSEGIPKGVKLSHCNFLANISQVSRTLNFHNSDKIFSCLPFFHSFGLGIGMLLPINIGIRAYIFPSPLKFKEIPDEIKKSKSTILFSTNTFLKNYERYAQRMHFQLIRMIIVGAEKLQSSTYELYKKKYDINILEGYGVTEASPAVSVNTFDYNLKGSVGKLLPDIEYRLKNNDQYKEGGELCLKGPNIMLGYENKDDKSLGLNNEWYETGDIVNFKDGYLHILGRAKRFSKIAGEMVSLSYVESFANDLWTNNINVACSITDSNKGETIVIVTDKKDATLDDLKKYMIDNKSGNLCLPKKLIKLEQIPLLGSGKVDYKKVNENIVN